VNQQLDIASIEHGILQSMKASKETEEKTQQYGGFLMVFIYLN
jgi:hypothetical protein